MLNSDRFGHDAARRERVSGVADTNARRVLVVDDSAFMRRVVRDLIAGSGEFDVVGVARDGDDAIRQVHALEPDIVTLDVDMPGLDGLDVLGYIMSESPRAVVMLSAGGEDGGARATLRALELGAVDFVRKPSGPISLDVARVGDRLLDALRAAAAMQVSRVRVLARVERRVGSGPARAGWRAGNGPDVRVAHTSATTRTATAAPSPASTTTSTALSAATATTATTATTTTATTATTAVVIAASTGGPAALTQLVPLLTRPLGAAVLVVQHMPKGFTASLAQRLHGLSDLAVCEAREGDLVRPDTVYIAPGGAHMRVLGTVDGPRIVLDSGPTVWGVRPAADPLFVSAAEVFGDQLLGVVLTGMGRDGAEGLRVVRAGGGRGVVQDPAQSVIPGMPNAALRHAGADAVRALAEMPATIQQEVVALRARRPHTSAHSLSGAPDGTGAIDRPRPSPSAA